MVVVGALEALCALGVSRPVALDWLWAFVPVAFLPAWAVLLGAVVLGRGWLAAVSTVAVAGHVLLVLPMTTGASEPAPAGATSLRVVTANVAHFNPTIGLLLDELVATDADVLVLQEVTHGVVPALEHELSAAFPHSSIHSHSGAFGGAVFSRLPLHDAVVLDVEGLPMLAVTIEAGAGEGVRVWNVHTRAPTELHRRFLRDDQLDAMIELRRFEHLPLIAAGDFNATLWHDELQDLVETDLRDAADVVGAGLRGTWKDGPFGLETPIDHVLVSDGIGVSAVDIGEGIGSDHRPVIADLWFSLQERA